MQFTSLLFLTIFLPISIIIYYFIPKKYINIYLIFISIIFYLCYGIKYFTILAFETILTYIISNLIYKNKKNKVKKKIYLLIYILVNISILLFIKINITYKIYNNELFLSMPIGMSFYIFTCLSYIIDVYKNKIYEKKILKLILYIVFFPKIIMGPIVRYNDIKKYIKNNNRKKDNLIDGFYRFCMGLCKKVLIANYLSSLTNNVFNINNISNISPLLTLYACISYTIQLYYDFSGYSDMAIGLSRIFGFNIKENFNNPLVATSAKDFWNRWHISLTSWFKEYVYIPLGGSKKNRFITIRNILIVWFLTGIWHGVSYSYLLWAFMWAFILIIEKNFINLDKLSKIKKILYSIFIHIYIVLTFSLFATNSMQVNKILFNKLISMFNINNIYIDNDFILWFKNTYFIFFIGIVLIILNSINFKLSKKHKLIIDNIKFIIILIFTIIAFSSIINNNFSSFLYNKF